MYFSPLSMQTSLSANSCPSASACPSKYIERGMAGQIDPSLRRPRTHRIRPSGQIIISRGHGSHSARQPSELASRLRPAAWIRIVALHTTCRIGLCNHVRTMDVLGLESCYIARLASEKAWLPACRNLLVFLLESVEDSGMVLVTDRPPTFGTLLGKTWAMGTR